MKCKEKEDLIEIRVINSVAIIIIFIIIVQRLQNENRLLRQRINLLETESNELADKLIQGQVRIFRDDFTDIYDALHDHFNPRLTGPRWKRTPLC